MKSLQKEKKHGKNKAAVWILLVSGLVLLSSLCAFAGEWKKDGRGWWYAKGDGTYPRAEWIKESGGWYYFDVDGYMQTGWLLDGGVWYYLEPDGKMRTAPLSDNEKKYYFSSSGGCTNPEGEKEGGMQEKERPYTGVLYGTSRGNTCTVHTKGKEQDYYLRFYRISGNDLNEDGELELGVYIRSGNTYSFLLPSGNYKLICGSGKIWYGTKYLFGPEASYMRLDSVLESRSGYYNELTLYAVAGGNTGLSPVPYQTD